MATLLAVLNGLPRGLAASRSLHNTVAEIVHYGTPVSNLPTNAEVGRVT